MHTRRNLEALQGAKGPARGLRGTPLRKTTSQRHRNSLGEGPSAINFVVAGSLQRAFEKIFLQ